MDRIVPFAKERSTNSDTTLMFPIPYFTNDGVVNCYPGDDFYPEHPDYSTTTHKPDQYASKSCEQFRSMAQKLHRSEMQSARPARILYNIQSSDNHINPQTIESAKLWFFPLLYTAQLNCYHCWRIIHKVHCTKISAIGCLCARYFLFRPGRASPRCYPFWQKNVTKIRYFLYCVKLHDFIYNFYCRCFCCCWFWDLFFVFICWKWVSIKW